MELVGLNQQWKSAGVVDTFESLIWTDRYDKPGDFELYTPIMDNVLTALPTDNFAYLRESEHIMVVESREIVTDPETGNHLITKGRSLESILDRRVIWYPYMLNGNLQTELHRLLTDTFIVAGGDFYRQVPGFVFQLSTDPAITALTIYQQFEVSNILDIVEAICATNGLGFKITLNASNQMVFTLYKGVDRTFGQTTRNRVIFSPNYDNLVNSHYTESRVGYRSVCYLLGEGQGQNRILAGIGVDVIERRTGLLRKEMVLNAGDLSKTTNVGVLSDAQYVQILNARGYDALNAAMKTIAFDGAINANAPFTYLKDFFMGDVVQVENEYGMAGTSRVVEAIYTQDPSQTSIIPTFKAL